MWLIMSGSHGSHTASISLVRSRSLSFSLYLDLPIYISFHVHDVLYAEMAYSNAHVIFDVCLMFKTLPVEYQVLVFDSFTKIPSASDDQLFLFQVGPSIR